MPLRILIVDDTRFHRELLRSIVAAIPEVTWEEAPDAASALQILAKSHFDVVTVDVEMPGMNGTELVRKIKRSWPHVMVGLISGAVDSPAVRGAMNGLADFVIAKPFAPVEVLDVIRKAMAPPPEAEVPEDAISVLIADDSRTVREMMEALVGDVIKGNGQIFTAADGQAAKRMVDGVCPDLVFLDINMPKGDGLEVLAFIRDNLPGAFVVMVTEQADNETVARARALGIQGYMLKPATRAKVAAMVDRFRKSR